MRQGLQTAELGEVAPPAGADVFVQHIRERRIGLRQPAARGDAVGFVIEARRPYLSEFGEYRLLHQRRMQGRYPVDRVAGHHREIGHADPALALFIDQGYAAQHFCVCPLGAQLGKKARVDAIDDLQMARQDAAEHLHRPGLQCLVHQRVVGIRENTLAQRPGLVPGHGVFIEQQAHQLRDRQHRVGVVEVDADLGGQLAEVFMRLAVTAQQILYAGANEEIFLVQTQLAPGGRGVIRIEHPADVLGVVFALDCGEIIAPVECAEIDFVGGLGRPQAQGVGGLRVVAGDDGVVGHGLHLVGADPLVNPFFFHHMAAELHPVHHLGAGKFPWVALGQPVIGNFDLPTVHNGLAEHAVVVADAVAKAWNIERGHGVQKTGRQPPQAAVAQSRIRLQLTDGRHIHAKVQQRLPHPGTQAQGQ